MKKIAIWKVILLLIITAGLYSIFWFARNRKYLLKHNAQKIPNWTWLLSIPIIYGAGCIVGFTYLVTAIIGGGDIASSVTGYNVSIFVGCLIGLAIYLWWLSYFAEGIETATHGRVPQWLSVLIGLFIGPFVIAIHQYYINRLNANKKGETYPVSSTLAIITSIFVVVGVFSFISTVSSFNASTQAIKTELIKTKERFAEVQNLNTSYTKCTAQLATDFPGDLTAENKDAYNAANEKCDKLFADYQAAMSKYLKGDRP